LFSRVFKNYQVTVGVPYQVKAPLSYETAEVNYNQPANGVEEDEENPEYITEAARSNAGLIIR
jgi:hypothetical protein